VAMFHRNRDGGGSLRTAQSSENGVGNPVKAVERRFSGKSRLFVTIWLQTG
jgi:hypothetical protein